MQHKEECENLQCYCMCYFRSPDILCIQLRIILADEIGKSYYLEMYIPLLWSVHIEERQETKLDIQLTLECSHNGYLWE